VAATGPLFVLEGIFGLTSLDDTVYAAEIEFSTSDEYLSAIPTSTGVGARVSSSPIGFPSVEGLAAADGILYGTSIDFPAHKTTLITIDKVSGIGSAVGVGDFDVILVGLAFDPLADILYGAGVPFGDPGTGVLTPNLYTVDRTTGDTTLVGDFGVALQSLAWDADLGLIGAFDHLYEIDTITGAASQIGTGDFTNGIPDMFNGLYSLAAKVTETFVDADLNMDGFVDGLDLGILLGNFGDSGIPASGGELSGSPPVDGLDLGILLGAWDPPAPITTVPEPSALLLVAMASLIGIPFRRRLPRFFHCRNDLLS